MLDPAELGWLAGIFDGEGSARIYCAKSPTGKRYFCQVTAVSNTDQAIIERTVKALLALGIDSKYHCRREDTGNTKQKGSKPHWKRCGDVRLNGYQSAIRFLEAVHPLTTGSKKEQARIVLEFLRSRVDRPNPGRSKKSEAYILEAALYGSQSFRIALDMRGVN